MSDATKPSDPDDATPKKGQGAQTWSQHLFVWTLVILVGVIFGMGGTVPLMMQGQHMVLGDIGENEVAKRRLTAEKLQAAINPHASLYDNGPKFVQLDNYRSSAQQQYAQSILLARLGKSEGFKPSDAVLDLLVDDFLSQRLPDRPGKTYGDALEERKGGDTEVNLPELKRFLAEQFEFKAMKSRHVAIPAVPLAVAPTIAHRLEDRVVADQVVLSAATLLKEVTVDDPEIQATYDRLRSQGRFVQPTTCVVAAASADVDKLMEQVPPIADADADVKTYYDGHKEEFLLPSPTPPTPPKQGEAPPAPEYKKLEDIDQEIRSRLRREKAEDMAKELVATFGQQVGDLGLEDKDQDTFAKAAADLGLVVQDHIVVDEPARGQLVIGDLGTLKQVEREIGLFAAKSGFISGATQTTGAKSTWLVLRLVERREAGARELTDPEVRKQVIANIAGTRAWKDLLEAAQDIRTKAETDPGGLKAYFASDDAKKWEAKVESTNLRPLDQLFAPPEQVGDFPRDPRLAASLSMPARPVMVASIEHDQAGTQNKADEDIPRVRLIQVTEYQPAKSPKAEDRAALARQFRDAIENYRTRVFYNELQKRTGER